MKAEVLIHCLRRLWKNELILRTREPVYEFETCQKGRAGVSCHVRAVNYYVLNNGHEIDSRFVNCDTRKKDGRSREVESKASKVLNFLKQPKDKAFYSIEIRKELEVKSPDIMTNVRRFEQRGLMYVRGYQSHDQRSPFSKGFILTWIDQEKPRDQAVREAFERTNKVIVENPTSNTIHERIRLIRDQLLTSNELLSLIYIRNVLNCPVDKVKQALRRAK